MKLEMLPSIRHFFVATLLACSSFAATGRGGDEPPVRVAFIGLHGGVFDALQPFAAPLDVELQYLSDAELDEPSLDLTQFDIVVIEHIRAHEIDRYQRLFTDAKGRDPDLAIVSLGGFAGRRLPALVKEGIVTEESEAERYYGSSNENLRRFLVYLLARYGKRDVAIEPPLPSEDGGLYHPDHAERFRDVQSFLRFARDRGANIDAMPRVVVAVHQTHLLFQQPLVVDALIRALEKRGHLAVAIIDQAASYEGQALEFKPDVIVHTCHSRDPLPFREKIDVPQIHSVFFRAQSIDEWETSTIGLAPNELNLHLVSQELIGGIDPLIGAGTVQGGGSGETFTPIPERIERIADRADRWARLRHLDNAEKRVAVLYWDREMGKAELMRGSATGMFMNGPRSLVNVLKRMRDDGYDVTPVPQDEDELIGWMMERGRQIGIWAGNTLDRLAKSGDAVLVPVETYRRWFDAHVPKAERDAVVARWGEAPGDFLVWKNDADEAFIVIPRVDLGNVILLPQPLRGEAHDTSLVHDRLVPPPHNYLCTYFWLQETDGFNADALVHFGTHGSELALPGKDNGLSSHDWPDMLIGDRPNLYPWILNNLGESSAARRRVNGVLIDHLVPPSVAAELSDELENLHRDIDKWVNLAPGALKERFRVAITRQVRDEHLDRDLHLTLERDQLLDDDEIQSLLEYLHETHNETTTVSLHVFGEAPPDALRYPYLVTCLGRSFLEILGAVVPVPAGESLTEGDREKYLRRVAEEAVLLTVKDGLEPADALVALGVTLPEAGISEELDDAFQLARQINDGLLAAPNEIDGLLAGLDGRFVMPGPGNPPDRNPGSLPTGRNLYVMNPEEVPTQPSWEVGVLLVEQLIAERTRETGHLPTRVAFTLSPFATFQDYGVMEAQILYLLGVRPVWDARNLVTDVELIPREELGRPRIDVFLATGGYYRDMLPTRMQLIDKAIRLVGSTLEEGNVVAANSQRIERDLLDEGVPADRANRLANARMFGPSPGEIGNAGYYYLVERSGEWESREELVSIYLEHSSFAYTDGLWGEEALDTYRRQVDGTDVVIRNWSDRTRSPVTNKYFWYKGGSLSLAIQQITGVEPAFFLADVRDPERAKMTSAEDALRQDYRVRLFNRKWIEGMMKEGYAGADQVSVCVTNSMGWEIMREGSVGDDTWEEIVNVYLRDEKGLNLREWFEAENPFAFQEIAETLLEVTRKGYWKPSDATLQEIAQAYAASIARHGEGEGLRGGGHLKLRDYLMATLADGGKDAVQLMAQLEAAEAKKADESPSSPSSAANTERTAQAKTVTGPTLTPPADPAPTPAPSRPLWPWLIGAGAVALFGLGAVRRGGSLS